ncbi:MAG: hypothetical protein GXP49_12785 [Deltaproteobacteria bacterium]|nr:hypothetical protein [Deltaproteobacteria bacterium]
MSDCSRFRDLMVEKLYGELDPRDQEALSLHLAVCEDCEKAWTDFSAIRDASSRLVQPEPQDGTVSFLLEQAGAETKAINNRRYRTYFRKVTLSGLALAAGALLVYGVTGKLLSGAVQPSREPARKWATSIKTAQEKAVKKAEAEKIHTVQNVLNERTAVVGPKKKEQAAGKGGISIGGEIESRTIASVKSGKLVSKGVFEPEKKRKYKTRTGRTGNKPRASTRSRATRRKILLERPAPKAENKAKSRPKKNIDKTLSLAVKESEPAVSRGAAMPPAAPSMTPAAASGIKRDEETTGTARYRRKRRRNAPVSADREQAEEGFLGTDYSNLLSMARKAGKSGDYEKALSLYLKALGGLEGKDEEDAYFEAATCALKLKKKSQAKRLLNNMVKKFPESGKRAKSLGIE